VDINIRNMQKDGLCELHVDLMRTHATYDRFERLFLPGLRRSHSHPSSLLLEATETAGS